MLSIFFQRQVESGSDGGLPMLDMQRGSEDDGENCKCRGGFDVELLDAESGYLTRLAHFHKAKYAMGI
jgi:hypothetical protein